MCVLKTLTFCGLVIMLSDTSVADSNFGSLVVISKNRLIELEADPLKIICETQCGFLDEALTRLFPS
jgi:hypothetical protein